MAAISPLKVGFVGLSSSGWASHALAPAIFQPALKGKIDLVAVSTRSQESAETSAAVYSEKVGHPVKAYSGSTSTIANDPDVNFVAVSVVARQHKEALLPAIEAGKSFFIEWPVGSSSQETAAIAEAARLHNVRSLVGLQTRASRAITKVREVLQSGKIGKVLSVQAVRNISLVLCTTVLTLMQRLFAGREGLQWQPFVKVSSPQYHKKDAGMSNDVFPFPHLNLLLGVSPKSIGLGHFIDAFVFTLGELKTVVASSTTQYPVVTFVDDAGVPTGQTTPSELYDHFSVIGELESGASYNIHFRSGEKTLPGRKNFEWVIDGEEGTILLTSDAPSSSFIGVNDPEMFVNGEKVELGGSGGAVYNIAETWKNFVEGKEGYPTIEDAVRNHARLDAIEKSIVEGRLVKLA